MNSDESYQTETYGRLFVNGDGMLLTYVSVCSGILCGRGADGGQPIRMVTDAQHYVRQFGGSHRFRCYGAGRPGSGKSGA